MAMSEIKTRTNIILEKELKESLEEIAKEENRSFNNLVITILKRYVKEYKESYGISPSFFQFLHSIFHFFPAKQGSFAVL